MGYDVACRASAGGKLHPSVNRHMVRFTHRMTRRWPPSRSRNVNQSGGLSIDGYVKRTALTMAPPSTTGAPSYRRTFDQPNSTVCTAASARLL